MTLLISLAPVVFSENCLDGLPSNARDKHYTEVEVLEVNMRAIKPVITALALSLCATAMTAQAQNYGTLGSGSGSSAGSPGSPTPQPYEQPRLRSAPSAAPASSPRLLNNSVNQPIRQQRPTTTLSPADDPIPELEEQLQRNREGFKQETKPEQ